jgi:hypothetical protein
MSGIIAPIVEGHSEVESVPVLLRRILGELWDTYDVQIARPIRVKRNRIVKKEELERAIKLVISDRTGTSAILILFDSDEDNACQLAQRLFSWCRNSTNLPVAVIPARTEFECWFLGAKESLRAVRGIRRDACNVVNPESIVGAKGQLSRNMVTGCRYHEVVDQPALAAKMDIKVARRNCPSFRTFICGVKYLVARMSQSPPASD